MPERDTNATPTPLRILGIDTSGRGEEIALLDDEEVIATRELPASGVRNAQALILTVRELFLDANIDPKSCDAIAVSHGPGSFTGLRIGVVFAKTWSYATGCKLTAVDTFQAIAMNAPKDVARLDVIADAQRNGVFVGRYERGTEGRFHSVGEITIEPVEPLCASRTSEDVVTGPGLSKYEADLKNRCRTLSSTLWNPSAEAVAKLGLHQLRQGIESDCWSLQPFYLRKSAAEEKWDANHPSES